MVSDASRTKLGEKLDLKFFRDKLPGFLVQNLKLVDNFVEIILQIIISYNYA